MFLNLNCYFQLDQNGDGFIDLKELRDALDTCGFKIPGFKVRQMEDEFKMKGSNNGKMSYADFEALCEELKANEIGHTYKKVSDLFIKIEIINSFKIMVEF